MIFLETSGNWDELEVLEGEDNLCVGKEIYTSSGLIFTIAIIINLLMELVWPTVWSPKIKVNIF